MKNISIIDSQAVFENNKFIYKCVLDDFKNVEIIGITTFNITNVIIKM